MRAPRQRREDAAVVGDKFARISQPALGEAAFDRTVGDAIYRVENSWLAFERKAA